MCFTYSIIPNYSFFSKEPIRTNPYRPVCKHLQTIENSYPFFVDGISIYSTIWIPTKCVLEKQNIPTKIELNYDFFIWNTNANEFLNFYLLYKDTKECGLILFPSSPFKENSLYVFYLGKHQFYEFLGSKYKKNLEAEWQILKNSLELKVKNPETIQLIEFIKSMFWQRFNKNLDSGIYSLLPTRSFAGLIPSLYYFIKQRSQNLDIKILTKKIIHKNYKNEYSGKLYLIQYREKNRTESISFTIPYLDFYHKKLELKKNYINQIYLFIPERISHLKEKNIILTNTNILDLSIFRKLSYDTNSIIIVYFIFENPFYNFLTDIFLYENLPSILKEINIDSYKKIYKICLFDEECITATFFEPNIHKVLISKIDGNYEGIINNIPWNYTLNKFSYYKKNIDLNLKILFNESIKDYLKEATSLYVYTYNQKKLKQLNYSFSILNIDNIYDDVMYQKLLKDLNQD
ncbi:MAG: hypothetical protein ACK4UJ_05075 [Leptonema sp. (in: bacteria)]